MTNAIAQLPSLLNSPVELVALSKANSDWQAKFQQAGIAITDSTYLAFPSTVETLSEIVKQAQRQQWRILICGNGSKLDWGGLVTEIDLVISTQKCNPVIDHAVGDLTVTVAAGVKLTELQDKLALTGQFLPIDPAFPQQATIGGIVATADTGSWRQRYGGVRDLVLGLSIIRADGKIAKAGGRVVKNVAGYDLMKLFTGSYGTLGIISQVTLRTFPLPEASQTMVLRGEVDRLTQAAQTLRSSSLTPTKADLISSSAMNRLGIAKEMGLIVRFQTINASIAQQSSQLAEIAQQLHLQVSYYQDRDESDLWQRLLEIIRIPSSQEAIICKIGIVPNQAVKLLNNLNDGLAMIHLGSGLGHWQLEEEDLVILAKMRPLCEQNRGFLTILTAPQSTKQQLEVWGYTGNSIKMMQTIKHKFDPNQILNPGRFVGGI
ncbi:FAD linked oxidase domain protein [Stanieria cyanosphaera PCC 7437]|uniref:FAD linked oxidase domain protein n=1 Tax=Stanieria cyanosphaera (strain ATCC 29371 / PCC 7437) TaxID=111780 RepID=K9XTK6_STAC7|nr:FAD-binding oxidoreductase [Stanieria cyanosphaera]AFZ34997.1 FAD linked oxidase domain protein [Stanieria cyanosphaera PCC 7437]